MDRRTHEKYFARIAMNRDASVRWPDPAGASGAALRRSVHKAEYESRLEQLIRGCRPARGVEVRSGPTGIRPPLPRPLTSSSLAGAPRSSRGTAFPPAAAAVGLYACGIGATSGGLCPARPTTSGPWLPSSASGTSRNAGPIGACTSCGDGARASSSSTSPTPPRTTTCSPRTRVCSCPPSLPRRKAAACRAAASVLRQAPRQPRRQDCPAMQCVRQMCAARRARGRSSAARLTAGPRASRGRAAPLCAGQALRPGALAVAELVRAAGVHVSVRAGLRSKRRPGPAGLRLRRGCTHQGQVPLPLPASPIHV